jgi:hydrogenase maturation protease
VNGVEGQRSVLVIGYGNDLRGDDCAGRRVAEIIATRSASHVKVRSVHQLTPDLAPLIAESGLTIFADACADELSEDVRVRLLVPSSPTGDVHAGTAAELLGIAKWLYGSCPISYAIDIAAANFDFCEGATPRTTKAIDAAVVQIDRLIKNGSGDLSCTK